MTSTEFQSLKIGDVIYRYTPMLGDIYIIVEKRWPSGVEYRIESISKYDLMAILPSIASTPSLWHRMP